MADSKRDQMTNSGDGLKNGYRLVVFFDSRLKVGPDDQFGTQSKNDDWLAGDIFRWPTQSGTR